MTRFIRPVLAPVLAAALLGACTSQTAGDPCASANAPVTFGNLLSNSLSGSYDRCLDTMREDLAMARLRARALQNQATQLRAEERRLSGERAAAARRLAEVNERQAATVAELERSSRSAAVERQRLEAVLAEERRITDEIEALNNRGGGATQAETAALQRRQDRLRTQVRAMAAAG